MTPPTFVLVDARGDLTGKPYVRSATRQDFYTAASRPGLLQYRTGAWGDTRLGYLARLITPQQCGSYTVALEDAEIAALANEFKQDAADYMRDASECCDDSDRALLDCADERANMIPAGQWEQEGPIT